MNMTCEEGAKLYCKNSWHNGGYASEAECLEHVDEHECEENGKGLMFHLKRIASSGYLPLLALTVAGIVGIAVAYAIRKKKIHEAQKTTR